MNADPYQAAMTTVFAAPHPNSFLSARRALESIEPNLGGPFVNGISAVDSHARLCRNAGNGGYCWIYLRLRQRLNGPFVVGLIVGGYGCLGVVVDVKNIKDANQFESLNNHLGWIQKFYGTTLLLCGGEKADQQPDAAGIDHGNFFEVQDETRFSGGEEIGEGSGKLVRRLAEDQLTAQLDKFDLSLSTYFDVQSGLPFQGRARTEAPKAALTLQISSVRVPHNLEEP